MLDDTLKAGPIPTVSQTLPDGTLIELVYDAGRRSTALAIGGRDQVVRIEPFFDLPTGERLVPYKAANNLIRSGCVLLPSAVEKFGTKDTLLATIRAFLARYVDLSETFVEIAAHYVLLSWVHDAFNELPYLRFRGDYGTGKTRALLAVGSLCYKPFFASGASTVSPIFHVLDAFGGTLILDEADFRFSDATAELTKILNNGNVKGLPVLRTMANRHRELSPTAFNVFGPKLVGMREHFNDRALESRFLTEETGGRPLPTHIPIHLPNSLKAEALGIRNQLLAWRFQARQTVGPDPSRLVSGVGPRINQTALALLSVVDDAGVREQIHATLVGEEARVREERASSTEALVISALREAFTASPSSVRLADLALSLCRNSPVQFESAASPKWVGWFVRTKLRLQTRKSGGVYVVPSTERPRLEALAARYETVANDPIINDGTGAFSTGVSK